MMFNIEQMQQSRQEQWFSPFPFLHICIILRAGAEGGFLILPISFPFLSCRLAIRQILLPFSSFFFFYQDVIILHALSVELLYFLVLFTHSLQCHSHHSIYLDAEV